MKNNEESYILRFMQTINNSPTFVSEVNFNSFFQSQPTEGKQNNKKGKEEITVETPIKVYIYKPVEFLNRNHDALVVFYSNTAEPDAEIKRSIIWEEDLSPSQPPLINKRQKNDPLRVVNANKLKRSLLPIIVQDGSDTIQLEYAVITPYTIEPIDTIYDHPSNKEIRLGNTQTALYLRHLYSIKAHDAHHDDRVKQLLKELASPTYLSATSRIPIVPIFSHSALENQKYIVERINNVVFI